MKLSKLKLNPDNPQIFDDLSILQNSIKEFPKMLELRPLVYDPITMYVLGGNKRLICLQNLGYKDISDNWIKSAEDLTDEEKKRFIIADNVNYGEWDEDKLLKGWNISDLKDWGGVELDIQSDNWDNRLKSKKVSLKSFKTNHVLISFSNDKITELQHLLDELYKISDIEIEQSAN